MDTVLQPPSATAFEAIAAMMSAALYLIVGAGSCVQAQTLAGMLLAKVSA